MDAKSFRKILKEGEGISIEFKSCQNGPAEDTYETVCSFLNRVGGNIFLGVDDKGKVKGIPQGSVQKFINDVISTVSNPKNFFPTVYLAPEHFVFEDMNIIRISVPPSSEVYRYLGTVYDRTNDADVKVTSTDAIGMMYLRKRKIYTERTVYPSITDDDLRFDLFPKIKQMASDNRSGHPWKDMSDKEIILSAGLYSEDPETKQKGYNLAAILLLGKDHIIKRICPEYCTDALLRKVNVDRYDDRDVVETNLIEAYDILARFAQKHLLNKFHLEDGRNISLSGKIAREMLINTLMHREFTSSYIAKFVIEKDRMYIENANRASRAGAVTPENLEPDAKNPIIAAFFRNIGYSDVLGSGTRNLYKYVRYYSGKDPMLIEGDVFRIIVPLDDNYSYDVEILKQNQKKDIQTLDDEIYKAIAEETYTTAEDMAAATRTSVRSVKRAIYKLRDEGRIRRVGSNKKGFWASVKNPSDKKGR